MRIIFLIILLFCLSLIGGFLSGFLGVGGAIVMIPLLLAIPPLFGFAALPMKTIAGISMLQAFFASLSAIVIHRRNRYVHLPTLLFVGIPMGISALSGSFISQYLRNKAVSGIFAGLVFSAFLLLLIDNREDRSESQPIELNKFTAVILGAILGIFTGIVGAGGGFVLIPLMKTILKIPFKIAIGTSLGIIFISTFLGAIGKIASFQVEFLLVLPVIAGSLLSAQLGAKVSKITSKKILRYCLLAVIFINLVQIFFQIF